MFLGAIEIDKFAWIRLASEFEFRDDPSQWRHWEEKGQPIPFLCSIDIPLDSF